MLSFVFRKIESRKWMVISLLIGNLLMIAIAAASPMYSQAVLQRTLTRSLSDYYVEHGSCPGLIVLRGGYAAAGKKEEEFRKTIRAAELMEEMREELDVPALFKVTQYYKGNVKAVHEVAVEGRKNELTIRIGCYSDQADHIKIVNGDMYSGELDDHTFDVIVNERTFMDQNLMLGEVLELSEVRDPEKVPYRIRIAGIFENSQEQDEYWIGEPGLWRDVCLMDEGLFQELFANAERMDTGFNAEWYATLDYLQMRGDQAEHYLSVLERYFKIFDDMGYKSRTVNFKSTMETFVANAQKLNITILILQMPIFVLLAVFIFMVSGQMLEMEQNEIAVYKSRGADKKQIVLVYLLQSVLISVLGIVGGIPLGLLMCRILGASNAFLEFVKRAALPVEIGPRVWIFAGAAALFGVCTMVLPVIRYANVNIVAHKRGKNRKSKSPWWQKLFLDVILLGVSLYGLYQYNSQKEYLAIKVMDGASLDPLLYFCSSLFMVGAGLFVLRIFPLLVKIIFMIGKRWWPTSLYVSFLRIIRTKSNQGFLMVFLILTLAMGIFNAQAARTINANAEDKIRYSAGADLVLQEVWKDNSAMLADNALGGGAAGQSELVYEEPDFGKYQTLEGIESVTKVFVDKKVNVSVEGGRAQAMLMGIHTKEFGETAWFKDSLLPVHWYEYLNAISQNSRAILVSSNFRSYFGYEVGDVLTYTNANNDSMRGIIYGFVDYWPSYTPITWEKGKDGVYAGVSNFLIVAHLSQLQSSWGVTPYQVWIKAEDSSQFIYEYAEESGTKYSVFLDAASELIDLKNNPIFQGTNGILTIGFICVLLLCVTGFLIYWILSIQSRTLQFGIFRAMGMSMKEILTMMVNEQIFITGVSIGAGILVGILTSRLYIPLIQIAYTSADQVIPLEIIRDRSDYARLFGVVGLAILICMFILGWLISKIKISQALKLGED
nr:FtsX-like permease family protein [uncultured Acetatifactor sp.]